MKQNLLFIKTILFSLLFSGLLLSQSLQAQSQSEWNGGEDDNWDNPNNWLPPGVPDASSNVFIGLLSGIDSPPGTWPVIYGPAVAASVDISFRVAELTIAPGGSLTTEVISNDGVFLMQSNAFDQASFIGNYGPGTGTFSYERFLGVNNALPPEEKGWHYISSPVFGFSSLNIPDYYLNTWDEPGAMWVQHPGQADCVPAPEIFNFGMDGWSVKWDDQYSTYGCPNPGAGQTVVFNGVPNFGNQFGTLTSGGGNFNMVGNPFPSYWDYDALFFGPNFPLGLYDAIYYWDEDANQYASYVSGTGTNGGGPIVPPAQAFFFEADGTEPTIPLLFTDAERVHAPGPPFYKDAAADLVRLLATANEFTDETVVHFDVNSTVNRDKNDARKLKSPGSTVPTIYTMGGDVELSINGLPATDIVPVYFECKTPGTYTIEASETSEFTYLVLQDMLTGQLTDLLEGPHTFEYTSTNEVRNFKLLYAPVGIGDIEASNIKIWSGTNNIYVDVPESAYGDIFIYNLLGQEIDHTSINPGVVNTIPIENANSYYIVKVLTGNNAITEKVYIK